MVEPIVERIAGLLKQRKMTATALTAKLNMPTSAVSEWKKGKTKPSVETLMKIADIFNVSISWLLTGNEEISIIKSRDDFSNIQKRKMKVYDLPASAGFGNYLNDDAPYSILTLDDNTVPARADFGIRISGDSMEPEIQDAEIVWVKEQLQVDGGDIGIFILNGDAYCKKLDINHFTRQVQLLSLNKKYAPIILQEYDTLRTVGKVL